LLVTLIVAMLIFVDYQAERYVGGQIAADIQTGRESVVKAEEQRIEGLRLPAGLFAAYPDVKALLDTNDAATIRDFIVEQKQTKERPELFIILDKEGEVIARTDSPEPLPIEAVVESGVFATPGGMHHYAVAPVDVVGGLAGYVMAGLPIDDDFARNLQKLSNDDVVIVGETVLGSSKPRSELPWNTRREWEAAVQPDGKNYFVDIEGDSHEAASVLLGREGSLRPLAVVMKSHDVAMRPYRQIQAGLLILGLIAAGIGVAASALLARNVTAPVSKLAEGTQQVAAGNFDYRLDIRTGDEIGDLADSFNVMIQGLRERADMQKFVSQSTVEMIQARTTKKVSAGEKVTLTILFSDMRGFTSMTEHRKPEDTVKLLNQCLSLQAEKVKKFHGDVDKFVGDCVVALFDGEDMALNAIRCAVEIHKALDALNASNPADAPIHVGIGIVTGEVILGSIGSEDRLDYTVIGSNVNLCSRLCSKAGPRETLISESTFTLVSGLVAAQKIEPLQVKGFSTPVPVYRMSL